VIETAGLVGMLPPLVLVNVPVVPLTHEIDVALVLRQ